MRRARESWRLLGRAAALVSGGSAASHAAAHTAAWQGAPPAVALPRLLLQLRQSAGLHSSAAAAALAGRQTAAGGAGRRLYQLPSLRQFSSAAPEGEERIMELMKKRLGKKATDQMLYGVCFWGRRASDCCRPVVTGAELCSKEPVLSTWVEH